MEIIDILKKVKPYLKVTMDDAEALHDEHLDIVQYEIMKEIEKLIEEIDKKIGNEMKVIINGNLTTYNKSAKNNLIGRATMHIKNNVITHIDCRGVQKGSWLIFYERRQVGEHFTETELEIILSYNGVSGITSTFKDENSD